MSSSTPLLIQQPGWDRGTRGEQLEQPNNEHLTLAALGDLAA